MTRQTNAGHTLPHSLARRTTNEHGTNGAVESSVPSRIRFFRETTCHQAPQRHSSGREIYSSRGHAIGHLDAPQMHLHDVGLSVAIEVQHQLMLLYRQ